MALLKPPETAVVTVVVPVLPCATEPRSAPPRS